MGCLRMTAILVTASVAVLAMVVYTPLPDGTEDPFRTLVFMAPFRLITLAGKVKQFLGYGSIYKNLQFFQSEFGTGQPRSASYGDIKVTREVIDGVNVIMYRPNIAVDNSPAIVYIHGGGWVLLSADSHDATVYEYAKNTNLVIFSVDYPRAPEYPYPTAHLDCLKVVKYVLRHGAQYGIDVTRVGVAGDSAGGNMAASIALNLTKQTSDLPPLKFQIIHYPVIQAIDLRLPSYADHRDTMPVLTAQNMCAYFAYYFGLELDNLDHAIQVLCENRHVSPELKRSKYAEYVNVKLLPEEFRTPKDPLPPVTAPYDEEIGKKVKDIIIDPLFSPLMAPDLSGLPPAFIEVCEFDILLDDGLLYARRLEDAGVQVDLYFANGTYHGDILKLVPDFLFTKSGQDTFKATFAFVKKILASS